jgi:hypothetical protein
MRDVVAYVILVTQEEDYSSRLAQEKAGSHS